jgi:cyanate permease
MPVILWIIAVILGIAAHSQYFVCLVLPVDLVEAKYTGSVTGILLSIGYSGGLMGPWIAGLTIDLTGQAVGSLYLASIISLVGAILCLVALPEPGKMFR